VAGVCILNTQLDQNCDIFTDTSFRTGSICSRCKDFYYLESKVQDGKYVTQCIQYYPNGDTPSVTTKPIKNCAQFNSDDLERLYCIQCETNYALLILLGDEVGGKEGYNRRCINATTVMNSMNCKTLELGPQLNGQLVCQQCKDFTVNDQYFLINKTQQKDDSGNIDFLNTCVNWNLDPNCDTYDIDTTLDRISLSVTYSFNYLPKFSSFKCTVCKPTHYLQ